MDGGNIKILLLRGINVGGKNKVPMADLKLCLEKIGFPGALTYIASGNVVLETAVSCGEVRAKVEKALPEHFTLNDGPIKVLVLTRDELRGIIENRPEGFGDSPDIYHSDVIFLIDREADSVLPVFKPREGVDAIWAGDGVIYSRRLSSQRTKSRMSRIISSPEYGQMTIRNWNTTTKLLALSETLPREFSPDP